AARLCSPPESYSPWPFTGCGTQPLSGWGSQKVPYGRVLPPSLAMEWPSHESRRTGPVVEVGEGASARHFLLLRAYEAEDGVPYPDHDIRRLLPGQQGGNGYAASLADLAGNGHSRHRRFRFESGHRKGLRQAHGEDQGPSDSHRKGGAKGRFRFRSALFPGGYGLPMDLGQCPDCGFGRLDLDPLRGRVYSHEKDVEPQYPGRRDSRSSSAPDGMDRRPEFDGRGRIIARGHPLLLATAAFPGAGPHVQGRLPQWRL